MHEPSSRAGSCWRLPLAELMAAAAAAARRAVRHPGHLLAQGVRPAHDAVPRPLRLLHVRQGAGPGRRAVPHARRGARDRAARRRARLLGGAVHARRGARGALPAGRRVARRQRLRVDGRLPRRRRASSCSTRPACSPTPTRARSTQAELERLRAVSPSQGMMIETLAARLGEPGGPHYGAPDKTPERRLATLEAAGPRARPVHHRDPRRHRRDARRAHRRARGDRRRAPPARPRAGSDRPELPAQAGHVDAQAAAVPARRVAVVDRGRAARCCPPTCTSRRRRTSATISRRCSRPASTTGAACRRSPSTT